MTKRYNELKPNFQFEPLKPKYHTNHRRPMTRRELVGQGFMHGVSFVSAPTLLGAFALKTPTAMAAAAECGASDAVGAALGCGYIEVQPAGGWKSAVRTFCVGVNDNADAGGFSDRAWQRNGIVKGEQDYNADGQNVNMDFNIALHANSPFTQGMLSKTDAACRANCGGYVITAPSENDTRNNVMASNYLVNKIKRGQFVQTVATRNRMRHRAVETNPAEAPVACSNAQQAMAFLDSGDAGLVFGAAQEKALEAATALARAQSGTLDMEEATKVIMRCAYDVSKDQAVRFNDPTILNAEIDTEITPTIFTENDLDNREKRAMASIMKMVVNGYAGTGVVEVGGCDYHGDSIDETDEKEFLIGEICGAALQYAHTRGQAVMITITSDGSVSCNGRNTSDDGRHQYSSDNSATSIVCNLFYSPGGTPEMNTTQIGGFTTDGNALVNSAATGNLTGMCDTVFLNYCSATGRLGDFLTYQNNSPLGSNTAALQQFIAVNPFPGFG